ncbi:PR-1-like protein [Stipitochalara longipes BDJ]|nr:PR-1-like protein [Stipitochalara longipes BDJ]
MKFSIYSAAFLASLASCQIFNVFITVETLYMISTQGQLGPPTIRIVASSIISSYVVLTTSSTSSSTSTKKLTSLSATSIFNPSSSSASSFNTRTSSSRVGSSSITVPSSLSVFKSISRTTSSEISSSSTVPFASSSTLSPLPVATDYVSTGLYYHNMHRRNHSAPLITWNAAQAVIAAEIASSCVFAHNMSVSGGGYGQNLAAYGSTGPVSSFSPSLMLAKSITNQWYYGEVNNFLPSYYGSSTAGCASQFCPAGTIFAGFESWFTVCNYVAPGNYIGSFGTNVFPSLGQPAILA